MKNPIPLLKGKVFTVSLILAVNITAQPSYENPVHWETSNSHSVLCGAGLTVTKSTESRFGSFAPRLIGRYSPLLKTTIPGILTNGSLSGISASGGKTIALRPQRLSGYYNYTPSGADKAGFEVLLSRWNSSDAKRETIAQGSAAMDATSGYVAFDIPLTYVDSQNMPDTALIVFSSSVNRSQAVQGSVLLIDNISFEGHYSPPTAVIDNHTVRKDDGSSRITPSGFIFITPAADIARLSVYDLKGAVMHVENGLKAGGRKEIKVTFPDGYYIMRIDYASGTKKIHRIVKLP